MSFKKYLKQRLHEVEDSDKPKIKNLMDNPDAKKALETLKKTRELSTNMLKPLNITMDSFLKFAKLSDEEADKMVDDLINLLDEK